MKLNRDTSVAPGNSSGGSSGSTSRPLVMRILWLFNQLLALPFIFAVHLYRLLISPFTPAACRFTPTCSQYSLEAFRKYGFFKGFYLTVKRLLRCHPFGGHGHDPLP